MAAKYLVDLRSELLRDLRLLGLHELPHHAKDVLAPLRASVRNVQVVEGNVLHDLCYVVDEKQQHRPTKAPGGVTHVLHTVVGRPLTTRRRLLMFCMPLSLDLLTTLRLLLMFCMMLLLDI